MGWFGGTLILRTYWEITDQAWSVDRVLWTTEKDDPRNLDVDKTWGSTWWLVNVEWFTSSLRISIHVNKCSCTVETFLWILVLGLNLSMENVSGTPGLLRQPAIHSEAQNPGRRVAMVQHGQMWSTNKPTDQPKCAPKVPCYDCCSHQYCQWLFWL